MENRALGDRTFFSLVMKLTLLFEDPRPRMQIMVPEAHR